METLTYIRDRCCSLPWAGRSSAIQHSCSTTLRVSVLCRLADRSWSDFRWRDCCRFGGPERSR